MKKEEEDVSLVSVIAFLKREGGKNTPGNKCFAECHRCRKISGEERGRTFFSSPALSMNVRDGVRKKWNLFFDARNEVKIC